MTQTNIGRWVQTNYAISNFYHVERDTKFEHITSIFRIRGSEQYKLNQLQAQNNLTVHQQQVLLLLSPRKLEPFDSPLGQVLLFQEPLPSKT